MVSLESHPRDMHDLLEDWQLEDMAWSLNIKLMRIPHEEFASYIQQLGDISLAS